MTKRGKNKVTPLNIGDIVGPVQKLTDTGCKVLVHVTKSGERANVQWLRRELKEKICDRFVPDPNRNQAQSEIEADHICACGYTYDEHTERSKENGQASRDLWDAEKDISLRPTSAFGELEFVGHGQKSKFVRVANNTSQETLKSLLMEQWKLKEPTALISVTGGAKDFTMKSGLERVVNEGVMKAVMTASAWIITGGMHAGIMKHVGEAVTTSDFVVGYKKKATVIGIAPWGCVANRQALISSEGKWPAEYEMDFSHTMNGECFLDMNHSHFILVDDGTKNKFHTEIALRAELEAGLEEVEGKRVPRVCVLLEGGPGSLETVKSAVEKDAPAIIVSGSGRCANIITYAYNNAEMRTEECDGTVKTRLTISDETRKQVRMMLSTMFRSSSRESLDKWVSWIEMCIKNKDMITIFSMDSSSDDHKNIDTCILTALLKAKRTDLNDQLKTLLSWNRVDIAKTQIFKDNHWRQSASNELFLKLIKDALKEGREHFVLIFLENGMNVKENLDADMLRNLYLSIPESSPLYRKLTLDEYFQLRDVGTLIKKLIGDYYQPLYLNNTYQREDTFSEPSRELFIWAVLMNLKTLARLLWVDVSNPIAGALTACELLRGMAKMVGEPDEKKRYEETANEFEALAVAVLQESYMADHGKAEDLLMREQPSFGNTTCLQLARHRSLDLIAHPCTQMLLNRIWNGKLRIDNKLWRILPCIVMLPLIFLLPKFIEDVHKDDQKTPESRGSDKTKRMKVDSKDTKKNEERNAENSETEKDKTDKPGILDFQDMGRRLNLLERLRYFYTAPRVVFMNSCVSYLIFLTLFSYDLMVLYSPTLPRVIKIFGIEIFLMIWVLSLLLEEIRQCIGNCTNITTHIKSYFSSLWNIIDISAILLFITASVLRFFALTADAGRYVMCTSLFLFFVRLLHIFSVFKQIGPTLIMIQRMLKDLLSFLLIIAVFFCAYGVVRQAILYPESPFSRGMLIYTVMRASYWQMFGELGHFFKETEDVEENGIKTCELQNGILENCNAEQLVVPIIKGIYILYINVLMFNLLIAMFNYTYTTVHENNDKVWSFQRYSLIREYYYRPVAPPPLILLNHIWLFVQWLRSKFCQPQRKDELKLTFETPGEKLREKELIAWENENADEYRRKRLIERETTEYKIKEKVDQLNGKVDSIQEQLLRSTEKVQSMEAKLDRTNESLEWIIRYLTSGSGGKSLPVQMSAGERMKRAAQESIDPEAAKRWPNLH